MKYLEPWLKIILGQICVHVLAFGSLTSLNASTSLASEDLTTDTEQTEAYVPICFEKEFFFFSWKESDEK
jgi:hypothetical protein